MEKEAGVCSRELAKRLCELGEPQDSLWYWVKIYGEWVIIDSDYLNFYFRYREKKLEDIYSAPTVAELGERLPARIIDNEGSEWFLEIWKVGTSKATTGGSLRKWEVKYRNGDCNFIIEYADNLANAMTEMRIYLLENKLIEEG